MLSTVLAAINSPFSPVNTPAYDTIPPSLRGVQNKQEKPSPQSVIKDRQQAYYDALEQADDTTDSLPFIEFIPDAIDGVLQDNLPSLTKPVLR